MRELFGDMSDHSLLDSTGTPDDDIFPNEVRTWLSLHQADLLVGDGCGAALASDR